MYISQLSLSIFYLFGPLKLYLHGKCCNTSRCVQHEVCCWLLGLSLDFYCSGEISAFVGKVIVFKKAVLICLECHSIMPTQLSRVKFSQHCCWMYQLSWTWHCVSGPIVPGILKALWSFRMLRTTHPVTQHHIAENWDFQLSPLYKIATILSGHHIFCAYMLSEGHMNGCV
jgi:hypothetical protein